jgi:outer membrane protein assembly factor BamB
VNHRTLFSLVLLFGAGCDLLTDPALDETDSALVLWRTRLPVELTTVGDDPSLARADIAVLASSGYAFALDASSGQIAWQVSDPAVSNPNLGRFFDAGEQVVGVYPGVAMSRDARTGQVAWRRTDLLAGKRGLPSSSGTEAFYADALTGTGTAVAFNTGASRTFPLRVSGDTRSTAANLLVSGDTAYSQVYNESRASSLFGELWLGRYDRVTGRALTPLRFPTDSIAPNASVTLAGDHVFISDADRNEVWAWNRFTGAARRIHKVVGGLGNLADVKVSGDTLVVPAANLRMYVYSISSGQLLFTVPTSSSLTSVAICGDVIYMQHGVIEAVSRTTGRSLGRAIHTGTIRMSELTKGPGYVFGWTPTLAYALSCPP